MKEQNNKYAIGLHSGAEAIVTASTLHEAKKISKQMYGSSAMTVQRIFKNSVRNVQNVGGKSHSIQGV